jgi:hypothetical protein
MPMGSKSLRLRLFSIPARLARHAQRVHLRLPPHNPWTARAVSVGRFEQRPV